MKIALVAGETSGDILGAGLLERIRALRPDAEFLGIAGPRMCGEGTESLYPMDSISIMGLDGLVQNLRSILAIRTDLFDKFTRFKPDVFVGIDVPDFNLTLEHRLRKSGIPTVHYVSPTVWAWRRYRIHKIRKAVSHMLTLFPFEEQFYQAHDIPVTLTGHPLADRITPLSKQAARQSLGLPVDGRWVALLPGSRGSEISRLGQPFIDAACLLCSTHHDIRFVIPCATPRIFDTMKKLVERQPLVDRFTLIHGNAQLALQSADVALLASGTAALEAALLCTPMVVAYRVSLTSYLMVKFSTRVEHYSMPNHLLEQPIVPEFIQQRVTPENLSAAVNEYLVNEKANADMRAELSKIRGALALGADARAAEVVINIAEGRL